MALKISVGSGATLASNIINGEHLQIISPVSIYPLPAGTNFIGLASILGTVGISGTPTVNVNGLVSLPSGTEVRSLATINNFPSGFNVNNLISLVSGTEVRSLATILNFPASQAITNANLDVALSTRTKPSDQQHAIIDSITPLISLASGTEVRSLATINNFPSGFNVNNFPATQAVSFNQLVSLASGTEVRSLATILNFPATQAISGNVGITGLISLASGTSVLTSFSGLISLASGTEIRSLATIMNFPAVQAVSQNGSWNVGVTGLVSLASGTEIRSLATIMNFPAVQAVSQNGTWNVGVTGLISLASGTEVRALATILNFPATQAVSFNQLVSLASGTEVRSLATINNFPTSFNVLNLVSVASINGLVDVKQSGIWNVGVTGLISLASGTSVLTSFTGLISLASGTEVKSLATILNWPTTLTSLASGTQVITREVNLISLASGTEVKALATILNFPATQAVSGTFWQSTQPVSFNQLVSLASGTFVGLNPGINQVGSVTISNTPPVTQSGVWTVGINSLVTLGASPNHIGSVSIFGTVNTTAGAVTLYPGPNQIGSVTISNIPAVTQSGTWTVGVSGLISLASGTKVIESNIQKNLLSLNALSVKTSQIALLKKNLLTSPGTVSGNSQMVWDGDETVYIYKPATTASSLFSYNIRTGTLTTLSVALDEGYTGASIVYASGKLYYTRGGAFSTFTRINTDGTSITAMTASGLVINNACAMVYDNNDLIYLRTNAGFEKYSISGNAWTTLTGPTGAATEGCSVVLVGKDRIYSLRGAGTTTFDMYKISNTSGNVDADTWTSKTAVPATVYDGGALAWNGDSYIYAFRGNGSQDFYRYDLQNNAWQTMYDLPLPASTGSSLVATDNGFLGYVVEPSNLNTTGFGTVNNLYFIDPTRTLAKLIAARYNSSQPAYATGEMGEIQMSADGSLVTAIDSTTEGATDGISNTVRVVKDAFGFTPNFKVLNWVYNGATWDRMPGDTTGVKVNVASLPSLNGKVAITGLISLASGTFVSLNAGINQIGSVTISNIPAVTQSGTWAVGVNGLISLASGTEVRSLATILNFPANYPVTNLVSIASINGLVDVKQSGTWTVQPGNTANSTPWLVTQTGGLLSLASGTEVRALATLLNQPALVASSAFIGLISAASIQGKVENVAGSAYIGLASVNIGGTLPALTAGAAYIGLASVNIGGTLPALTASSAFIGLVSAASINGTVALVTGTNYIGFATVTSTPISGYTAIASLISASGNSTLFVPPSANRWVLKDLIIGSQGQTQVGIRTGARDLIFPIALATMGGYISNFGDSGLAAASINDSFVIVNNSAVTISVTANVRFQAT